jgi:hypothetical protein
VSVSLGAQDFKLLALAGVAIVAVGCVVGLSSGRTRSTTPRPPGRSPAAAGHVQHVEGGV